MNQEKRFINPNQKKRPLIVRVLIWAGLAFVGIMIFGIIGVALESPEERAKREAEQRSQDAKDSVALVEKRLAATRANELKKLKDDSIRIVQKHIEDSLAWIEKEKSEYIEAITMSQLYVKDHIKAPSTAEFPHECWNAHLQSDTIWFVKACVDAQNSYGAMLRNQYKCQLKKVDEDSWQLIYLDIY